MSGFHLPSETGPDRQMDAILRTLERLLVWVQVGLGGETPWVSTCKGIFFSGLTHQKVVIPFLGGFPSDRLQCFFFSMLHFFISGVQGKYVKAYLSDFVRIFHWLLLTPQRRQPLTHSQTLDPNQCNRQVKKPSRVYFHNFMAQRNHIGTTQKMENRVLGLVFWWLFRDCILTAIWIYQSKMGTKHSKHPTFTWCDRIPWLWRPFVIC